MSPRKPVKSLYEQCFCLLVSHIRTYLNEKIKLNQLDLIPFEKNFKEDFIDKLNEKCSCEKKFIEDNIVESIR